MTYEIIENELTGQKNIVWNDKGIIRFIPMDKGNSDYQRYLRWLEDPTAEEGGTLS